MARNGIRRKCKDKRKGKGDTMGSTLAAMAMSAFAMGAGAPSSTAQASIPPRETADAVRTCTIPAGSMADALSAFADANGFHLLYDTRLTQAMKTSGLSGRYSPQQGIGQLLSGTSLSYRFVRKGKAVSIVLAQADSGTQTDTGVIALPTVEVTAEQGGQGTGGRGWRPPGEPGRKSGLQRAAGAAKHHQDRRADV